MSREIKFRGKRVDNGEWAYGSLVNNLWTYSEFSGKEGNVCEIITGEYLGDCWSDIAEREDECIVTVLPESVGQFTGLKDKTGKEIYEGDIVNYAVKKRLCPVCSDKEVTSDIELKSLGSYCPHCGRKSEYRDFITRAKVVFTEKAAFAYESYPEEGYYQSWPTYAAEIYVEWVEILGNLFETPELLTPKTSTSI